MTSSKHRKKMLIYCAERHCNFIGKFHRFHLVTDLPVRPYNILHTDWQACDCGQLTVNSLSAQKFEKGQSEC